MSGAQTRTVPNGISKGRTPRQGKADEEARIELVDARQPSSSHENDRESHSQNPSLQSSVLRDALSKRRWSCFNCLAYQPHPICNFLAMGLALSTLVFVLLYAVEKHDAGKWPSWTPFQEAAAATNLADISFSPEGALRSNIGINTDWKGKPRELLSEHGMVAADHGRCSEIGMKVLADGGNAVDAAVATALCQGVLNPMASGLGGGGFMVIQTAQGETQVIDGREVAPAAASERMFAGNKNASLDGGLAVAVPLELKGMWMAHQRYGQASWATLVSPAASLARNGFPAHPYLVNALNKSSVMTKLVRQPGFTDAFYKSDGKGSWRAPFVNESCCIRTNLADLLDAIGAQGPDALYLQHADDLAAEIKAAGGIVTAQDLRDAAPLLKEPLTIQARGLRMLVPPPPSGGAAVLAGFQMIAAFQAPMAFAGFHGSTDESQLVQPPLAFSGRSRTHRLVEVIKNAFAMRSNLGDPGVCGAGQQPGSGLCFQDMENLTSAMLSPGYADSLKSKILDNQTEPYQEYGGEWHIQAPTGDHGTSHLSLVDSKRNAVSFTTTINTAFGSKILSPSTGIILNNQMDDFSTPDQTNTYGLPPSQSNFIRPFKKPQSSMSPVIITATDGRLRAALGASGGPRIISSMIQTLFRLIELGDDLLTAIALPRVHDQVVPNSTFVEHWTAGKATFFFPEDEIQALEEKGHKVETSSWGAVVQGILVDPSDGYLTGVSDLRKDGSPAGY